MVWDMNIIDKRKKKYHTDVAKIIKKILNKIPAKYLDKLGNIYIYDSLKRNQNKIEYVISKEDKDDSEIIINMEGSDFNGIPFISILAINIYFIMVINKHIEYCLKPKTNDDEIISYVTSRINYSWMWLGIWTPLLSPIMLSNFILFRFSLVKTYTRAWATKILNKLNNNGQ